MKVHLFLAFFLILSIVEKVFSQQCLVAEKIEIWQLCQRELGILNQLFSKKLLIRVLKICFQCVIFLRWRNYTFASFDYSFFYCKWPHNVSIHVMLFCIWKVSAVDSVTNSVLWHCQQMAVSVRLPQVELPILTS